MFKGSRFGVVATRSRWSAVGGCTQEAPQPDRTGTVVVAVGMPFTSLNGGTAEGRAPGSTLVRSLVQAGFVSLDEDGTAVLDEGFGTVEKVSDSPLTVKYTIDPSATWSDGTPVTPADLLLEWAARSGQLDDVTPELDAQGGITNNDELDAGVAFAAASPALVQAQQLPTVDGATLTLVYATPVPDWQVALDVNVPAHVVGQTALGVEDPTEAAAAVSKAIVDEDKAALSSISAAWRTDFDADALAQHVDQAVSTGPYAVDVIVPGERVELVRNEEYQGDGAASYDRVVVRSDLEPLEQVEALAAGTVDVVAPDGHPGRARRAGGGDRRGRAHGWRQHAPARRSRRPGPARSTPPRTAVTPRSRRRCAQAFLLTVPRDALVSTVVAPLWPEAVVATALLPTVGPDAGGDVAPSGPADIAGARRLLDEAGVTEPVAVQVLVNTTDPLRAAMLALITESAADGRVRGRAVHPGRRSRAGPGGGAGRVGRGARAGAAVGPAAWTRCCRGGGPGARRTSPAGRTRPRTRPRRRSRRRSTRTRSRTSWPRSRRASTPAARCSRWCGSPSSSPRAVGGTDRRDHPGGARRRAAGARPGGPDLLVGVGARLS